MEIEPKEEGRRAPLDLRLSHKETSCAAELMAVIRDAKTLDADRWLDTIEGELTRVGRLHGVDFSGRVEEPLDERLARDLLRELEQRAAGTAAGLVLGVVEIGGVSAIAGPATGEGGGLSFQFPTISYERRIGGKLRAKAKQALNSGADWIVVDWMDHLWHMTAWGARPLAEKASDLAGLARRQLGKERHIKGVVLTDGAVLMRPDVPEQTTELPEGILAMCRQIDKWHARESVVIPLDPIALNMAQLWVKLLDAEHGWTARELATVGLDPPDELA